MNKQKVSYPSGVSLKQVYYTEAEITYFIWMFKHKEITRKYLVDQLRIFETSKEIQSFWMGHSVVDINYGHCVKEYKLK